MQSASSSTTSAAAATSPTRTLFNLPEPQSLPTVPAAGHPRASITRSSMATTLGGHIEGAQGADIERLSSKAGRPPGGLHVPGRTDVSNDGRRPLWSRYMMRKTKNHLVAALSEFVGTTLFLLLAFGGTNVANIPDGRQTDEAINTGVDPSQLLYIALSFGFSLCVNAWIFFRVSGGLFNPAVSLGLALVGAITPGRACLLILAQILGGMTGAALIDALLPGPLLVRTSLNNGISTAQGLFLEMFLTALLMLAILFLAAEKHRATFLAPVGIGLALFIAELTGVYYTGGSLNPARSFGPDVVAHSFPGYHWIYWLGPCMGASLAAGLYRLLKALEYEDVVPDQDAGPAQIEPLSDEDAEHHERRIRQAQSITQSQLAHHLSLVERAGGYPETQLLSTENVNAARIGELSAKLDAILSAVTAINLRERAALQASQGGTPQLGSRVATATLERPHNAPFTVLH